MKRFTETAKWDDPWFRALPGHAKLAFLYIVDRCDNAGFWEIDKDGMQFQTKLSQAHCEGALKALERGLIEASGWVWVRTFLKHQKNETLNPENPAHRQIIALIKNQTIRFPECLLLLPKEGASKGLQSPIGIGIGKGRGKSKKRDAIESTPEMIRIGKILGRRESTLWSADEIEAFGKVQFVEEEILLVEAFYKFTERGNEPLHRRTTLITLLRHWGGEVDKGRLWSRKYGYKAANGHPGPKKAPPVIQPLQTISREELSEFFPIRK